MTWTEWLILGPMLCNLVAATGYGTRGEWGFALAYLAYATANGALMWAAVAGRG